MSSPSSMTEGEEGDRDVGQAERGPAPRDSGPLPNRTVSLEGHADRTLTLTNLTGDVGLDPGTFLQRSGVSLFLKVLLVSSVVLLALFINLMVELAHVPEVPPGSVLRNAFARGDTAQTLRLAAHYEAVSEVALAHRNAAWTHFILGVKELVVTVFLPLMTGILGYIFGTRTEAAQNGAGGGETEP